MNAIRDWLDARVVGLCAPRDKDDLDGAAEAGAIICKHN
jgi:hypothetical protein